MPFTQLKSIILWLHHSFQVLLLATIAGVASAQEPPRCTSEADTFVGNAQSRFKMTDWIGRGTCIRSDGNDQLCYETLMAVIANLNNLRQAEYSGAAGVLALLPTVGALFGAPTNEIWTLWTILPFGGAIAMALSFGGAIMPVRVEDYEEAIMKGKDAVGSIVSFRPTKGTEKDAKTTFDQKLGDLKKKLTARLLHPTQQKPGKSELSIGLLGMMLLFIGSQTAMIVLEQGGVLPWWCSSRWWMHLWYFMVTLTAVTENIVQLPFTEHRKLYVSRVAYNISLDPALDPADSMSGSSTDDGVQKVAENLKQMMTMKTGQVTFTGSTEPTESRNAVLVMVSQLADATTKLQTATFLRLLSKSTSIAVFITGTAMFAAVTLVSLPMAVLALTLVLSAGVFGRAIAGWMVRRIGEKEPMIHVIVNKKEESDHAIWSIFNLPSTSADDMFQIEIDGFVFINKTRVARRSKWYVRILGVLANPYDLRRLALGRQGTQPLAMANDV